VKIAGDARLTDRRITEWFLLEKARRKREPEPTGPRIMPVITISRQFCAGGHTVAARVAERLGERWQIWDSEIIDAIALDAHVRREMVEALEEHTQSWMVEMARSLFGVRVLESQAYRHHLAEVLLAVAQQGYKIIIGRGANFVLTHALNVRLRASLEFRVKAAIQRENIPYEDALRQVHQVDRDRTEFMRSIFKRKIDDPSAYDMTLSTDTMGMDAAAAAIVAAAHEMFALSRK
jgi:hypothetical protein